MNWYLGGFLGQLLDFQVYICFLTVSSFVSSIASPSHFLAFVILDYVSYEEMLVFMLIISFLHAQDINELWDLLPGFCYLLIAMRITQRSGDAPAWWQYRNLADETRKAFKTFKRFSSKHLEKDPIFIISVVPSTYTPDTYRLQSVQKFNDAVSSLLVLFWGLNFVGSCSHSIG